MLRVNANSRYRMCERLTAWLHACREYVCVSLHHITIDIAFEQSVAVFSDHVQPQTANGSKSNTALRTDASHVDEQLFLKASVVALCAETLKLAATPRPD